MGNRIYLVTSSDEENQKMSEIVSDTYDAENTDAMSGIAVSAGIKAEAANANYTSKEVHPMYAWYTASYYYCGTLNESPSVGEAVYYHNNSEWWRETWTGTEFLTLTVQSKESDNSAITLSNGVTLARKSDWDTTNESVNVITTIANAVDKATTLAGNKMDKENPTGTGSFSLNRKADSTIGNYSTAEGQDCIASGLGGHAEGSETEATGVFTHAEGSSSIASGDTAHAEGTGTEAAGDYSHAEGYGTKAQSMAAHTEGFQSAASGSYAHAEGIGTIAAGEASHVQGKYNNEDAENKYAHIIGGGEDADNRKNIYTLDWSGNAYYAGDIVVHDNLTALSSLTVGGRQGGNIGDSSASVGLTCDATGVASFAEGASTVASGEESHAEGFQSTAEGEASHAEGLESTASGRGSHAENNATASGINSHAENSGTASATGTHAEGRKTLASSKYQHVQGKYNVEDTSDTYAHIVGGGTSDDDRKNIHTLDWSGNAVYAGDVTSTDADGATHSLNAAIADVSNKVDKVEGKDLSTNDFTDDDKEIINELRMSDIWTPILDGE